MSYLRFAQEGQYVDIPGGSAYYLYSNGNDINGWSYAQWAALISGVVDEIDWEGEPSAGRIVKAFSEHYGGYDENYRGTIAPPERAEIFCQCVDSRIDSLELTDELHEAVRAWADEYRKS